MNAFSSTLRTSLILLSLSITACAGNGIVEHRTVASDGSTRIVTSENGTRTTIVQPASVNASTNAAYNNAEYTAPSSTASAGMMAFDLGIQRPLGLVATVLGAGAFILQLPFDLALENGTHDPFQKLVVAPARYTFARPLGQREQQD